MPAETFGQYLKRERELRHVTLEEVASGTKIAIHMLRAMEADRWDEIPAEIFIRGFIKHYAEFIGLVPEDVYLRYQEERGVLPEEDYGEAMRCSVSLERTYFSSRRLIWIAVLMFVALLILGVGIFFLGDDEDLGTEDRAAARPPAVSMRGDSGAGEGAEKPITPARPEAGESHPIDNTKQ
jgi:cytoskeleton protein RodZ